MTIGSPLGAGYELATDAQFRELSNLSTPPRAGRITAIEASGQVRVECDDPDGGDVLAWPLNGFSYAVGDVVYLAFAVNWPDSALVIGSRGLPTIAAALLPFVKLDGTTPLTAEWDIGEDMAIRSERLEARDNEGLSIQDDGGNIGVFIADGGDVTIPHALEVDGGLTASKAGAHVLERTTAVTNQLTASTVVRTTTSNAMADGFGTGVLYQAIDNDAVGNTLGLTGAVRNGADNSGALIAYAYLAGVAQIVYYFIAAGAAFLNGLTSGGAASLGIKAGSSSNDAAVGGVLYVATLAVGNVGAGIDDLISYSVPANTLAVNGQSLWFEAYGTLANNANSKTVRVSWGSDTSIVVAAAMDTSNTTWSLKGRIFRTGAATQKIFIDVMDSGDMIGNQNTIVSTGAQTLSGAVTLKITGEGVSNNDIVCEALMVGWDDANI